MKHMYRLALIIFTPIFLSSCTDPTGIVYLIDAIATGKDTPCRIHLSETPVDPSALESVNTIALLDIPYSSSPGKELEEYREFNFGNASRVFLKYFLQENGYQVIEYSTNRKNKYPYLIIDYEDLDIPGADAYLDVALVIVEFRKKELNNFIDNEIGPQVRACARLVSASTKSVIYAGPIQYGWNLNPSATGIKIESPEDQVYESYEALRWEKKDVVFPLVYGIEVVSLNIAKMISKGAFVSEIRPPIEGVRNGDGNGAAPGSIAMAESEIAAKKHEERLWLRALALANGDEEKRKDAYIKLRSIQLTGEKKKAAQFAKIAQLPQISGTYISSITSNSKWQFKKKYQSLKIVIKQGGKNFTAFDDKYKTQISGTIEPEVIRFHVNPVVASGFYDAEGEWRVSADGTTLEGYWTARGSADDGSGEWNLTRIK